MRLRFSHYVKPERNVERLYLNGHGVKGLSVWLEQAGDVPTLRWSPAHAEADARSVWRQAVQTFALPVEFVGDLWQAVVAYANEHRAERSQEQPATTTAALPCVILGPACPPVEPPEWSSPTSRSHALTWLMEVRSTSGRPLLRVDLTERRVLDAMSAVELERLAERWQTLGAYPGFGALIVESEHHVWSLSDTVHALLIKAALRNRISILPSQGRQESRQLLRALVQEFERQPAGSGRRRPRDLQDEAARLVAATGISQRRAEALIKAYGSLAAIRRASFPELAAIPGIGPKTANSVAAWLHRGAVVAVQSRTRDPPAD